MNQSAELELLERIATPSRLGQYIGRDVWGDDWKPYPFLIDAEKHIVSACLSEDTDDFLMMNVPPQSGKTSFSGFLLILWFLGHFPDKQVIFVSYSDDYSRNWGALVRDAMKKYGGELFGLTVNREQEAASDWSLKGHPRGGMLSVGIGSQITGRSGDLVVVDDVIKNMEEAASATIKKKHLRDWDGTIITRRQPGCTYVITATRFADDDLSGGLWERTQKKGYKGDTWTQLVYPAIAVEGDLLGREVGDPLHTRFTRVTDTKEKSHFLQIRNTIDPFTFDCLYQQDPSSSELGMFPPDKWRYMLRSEWPDLYTRVRAWDLAATEGSGDWTVGAMMGKSVDGDLFVCGRYREQHSADVILADLKAQAVVDGPQIPILIERERSGAGKTNVEFYRKELTGFTVEDANADGTKEQRARPYEVMQKSGRVILPADEEDEDWVKEWVTEHKGMMGDGRRPRHDDQVDTGAYAARYLLEHGVVELIDPNDIELNFKDMLEFDQWMETIGL